MSEPKLIKNQNGEVVHYSVGAVMERDGKFLLIDRLKPPYGFAGVAGHIDEGEDALTALKRELWEESGLNLESAELLFEEELPKNTCRRGVDIHHWYLYKVKATGEIVWNKEETKSIGWYSKNEIEKLVLEPAWEYWFNKLKI